MATQALTCIMATHRACAQRCRACKCRYIRTYTYIHTYIPSVQIDAEESLDRFEQWVHWDFISFHKGIHHSVLQVLTYFQQKDALQWNITTNASGVFGSLVHKIGHIFRIIMALSLIHI